MGLSRSDVIKKINIFSCEENKEELIKLLCTIINDVEFRKNNYDLIEAIISIGELYGYYSYFKEMLDNSMNCNSYSENIRKNMYKSFDGSIYYNSGQLSLLNEIKTEKKLFVSAPTTFGKTKLVLDYIYSENKKLNNILFLIPTNSLSEEIYIKLLQFNSQNKLNYYISTNPKIKGNNNILVLTPEKYLLLIESKNIDFDLYVMDESYKIEEITKDPIKDDPLNERSSKFRRIMEIIANKDGKTIYLSPFTYDADDSMKRFFDKYDIKKTDRKDMYVNKNLYNVDSSSDFKKIVSKNIIGYQKDMSGISKASMLIKELSDSTIVYVRFPLEALKFMQLIDNKIDENTISQRFKKFLEHIENNYEFEDSNWYVLEGLKKGIGIYVSPMPRYIKREIIDLFNNGELKILVVTSAFAEGVNSSAKNIIITNDLVGSNIRMTDLELLNLSGRAGRFGIHSEGNIYSVKEEIHTRLLDSINKGVKISNVNFEVGKEGENRPIYDIEIIDKNYLNSSELSTVNAIEKYQEQMNLTDDDLNVALSISKLDKLRLYMYFINNNDEEKQNKRMQAINNLLNESKSDAINSMKYIFDELVAAGIKIIGSPNDIPAYSKDVFLWGKFYGIHSSGNIKNILKNRKEYIIKEYNIRKNNNNLEEKSWIDQFITDGNVNNFKLYNQAFKFITNIIEYRIPFYIGFYVSIFKLYCKKNNINYEETYDIVEISASLENKTIEEKYDGLIEYGFPIDMIKKVQNSNGDISVLDSYEKLIYEDYKKMFEY